MCNCKICKRELAEQLAALREIKRRYQREAIVPQWWRYWIDASKATKPE